MFACDYKNVRESTPVEKIKTLLDKTGAALHIVNVYEGDKELKADKSYQQELLHSMLQQYGPAFHYVNDSDFMNGINTFVDEHAIDMIITIPRKHGFFDNFFKESHTKKLAFHTHVPLMFIREEV